MQMDSARALSHLSSHDIPQSRVETSPVFMCNDPQSYTSRMLILKHTNAFHSGYPLSFHRAVIATLFPV